MSADQRLSAGRPGQYKPKATRESEAARRRDFLARQQSEARTNRLADIRRVAAEALLGSAGGFGDASGGFGASAAGAERGLADPDVEVEIEDEEEDDDNDDGAGGADDAMCGTGAGAGAGGDRRRRLRRLHRTLFFARQLQIPDWLMEVPNDLGVNWLVSARPEGERCLLLSDGGRVEVRRKNGYVQERYTDSRMPRGLTILDVICIECPAEKPSRPSRTREEDGATMCDVVSGDADLGAHVQGDGDVDGMMAEGEHSLPQDDNADDADSMAVVDDGRACLDRSRRGRGRGYEQSGRGRGRGRGGRGKGGAPPPPRGCRKYAVCDVLIWDDNDLCFAEAECRMFWLESRFSELPRAPRRARELQLVHSLPATPEAIQQAYHGDIGCPKDSLHFLHREGHYCMAEAVSPLALMWRDRTVSRYVVDTPDEKGKDMPDRQAVVLELRGGGRLRTADRLLVGQLQPDDLKDLSLQSGGKHLLRCEVERVDLAERQVHGLRVMAQVPARSRIWPDPWNRIAFQSVQRAGGAGAVTIDALVRAAAGAAALAG